MKITQEDIETLNELLDEAEVFRPVIEKFFKVLWSYSEEIKKIPEALSDWLVDTRIKMVEKYQQAGFDKDDAIIMVLSDMYAVQKISDRMNKNKE